MEGTEVIVGESVRRREGNSVEKVGRKLGFNDGTIVGTSVEFKSGASTFVGLIEGGRNAPLGRELGIQDGRELGNSDPIRNLNPLLRPPLPPLLLLATLLPLLKIPTLDLFVFPLD
jgi:hypothetical protein